jgi:hypothetical protein
MINFKWLNNSTTIIIIKHTSIIIHKYISTFSHIRQISPSMQSTHVSPMQLITKHISKYDILKYPTLHFRVLACYALFNHTNACSLFSPLKENFIILAHGSLVLMITHHIMNLGPRCYYRTTERVDNTILSSSVARSEFSTLCASHDGPGPAKSLFSSRTPTPITHMHVFIFKLCKY